MNINKLFTIISVLALSLFAAQNLKADQEEQTLNKNIEININKIDFENTFKKVMKNKILPTSWSTLKLALLYKLGKINLYSLRGSLHLIIKHDYQLNQEGRILKRVMPLTSITLTAIVTYLSYSCWKDWKKFKKYINTPSKNPKTSLDA